MIVCSQCDTHNDLLMLKMFVCAFTMTCLISYEYNLIWVYVSSQWPSPWLGIVFTMTLHGLHNFCVTTLTDFCACISHNGIVCSLRTLCIPPAPHAFFYIHSNLCAPLMNLCALHSYSVCLQWLCTSSQSVWYWMTFCDPHNDLHALINDFMVSWQWLCDPYSDVASLSQWCLVPSQWLHVSS